MKAGLHDKSQVCPACLVCRMNPGDTKRVDTGALGEAEQTVLTCPSCGHTIYQYVWSGRRHGNPYETAPPALITLSMGTVMEQGKPGAAAFYVDPATWPKNGKRWSHLMTDGTETDLVHFARSIGLPDAWIQHSGTERVHYDVTGSKREAAIRAGAREVTGTELVRLCVHPKRKAKA